jgi:hypothetical protein
VYSCVLLTKHYTVGQIKIIEIGGKCDYSMERKGACRILVGKPEGKRQLGRLETDDRTLLKWFLKLISRENVDRINLA